jgi:hypothetical protein
MNMKRDEEQIQLLIRKYREGKASDDDLLSIEYFVENDMLSLEDLDDVRIIERKIEQLETPAPSLELDTRFYQLLSKERAPRICVGRIPCWPWNRISRLFRWGSKHRC